MKPITSMHSHIRPPRGAVLVTTALFLLFLLGFMGIALDLGRLFVVNAELQTAVDSCALAAAQELDLTASAITRAQNAGQSAANRNGVDFQSSNWRGKGQVTATEITFRDKDYKITTDSAQAVYAQCAHTQASNQLWLLPILNAVAGTTTMPTTANVAASAVASRASAQTTCPLPVALKPRAGKGAPDYGFQVGEWATIYGSRSPGSGEFGWYNIDSSNNATETKRELSEGATCGTRVGDQLYTPGAKTSADEQWNYRFGIYKNGDPGPSVNHPDFTGYAYTANNWKNTVPQNAYSGTPAAGSAASAQNYVTKKAAFASFDNTGTDIQDGSQIVFGKKNQLNSFKTLATPGATGEHQKYGYNRRLAVVPVVDDSSKIIDYVCVFMLQPMSGPNDDVQLEYRGNAGSLNSPCVTAGLPGGSAGPKVPTLVR